MPSHRTTLHVLTALAWAAGASAQEPATPAPGPASPFRPDTVVESPGRARVLSVRGPDADVAALRLFVPLVESPDEAGTGRILRDLAADRLSTLARPFGVRVTVERTAEGLAYSVAGAVADLEVLAWLLREVAAEPDVTGPAFGRARAALREEASRRTETPEGRLAAELRVRVAPEAALEVPEPAAVDALSGGAVLAVWRRTHRASAMTLVVSAPVTLEVVLAATQGIGLPGEAAENAPPPLPAPRSPDPETLRLWSGVAYPAGPADDPTAAVAVRLVARALERSAGAWEASVQLWTLPGRSVLAVLGAAYPRSADGMRRAVEGAVGDAAAQVDEATVRDVADRLRRQRLFGARSTVGLVEAVGRAWEPGSGSAELQGWLDALAAMDAARVRAFLETLAGGGAVRAEVRP